MASGDALGAPPAPLWADGGERRAQVSGEAAQPALAAVELIAPPLEIYNGPVVEAALHAAVSSAGGEQSRQRAAAAQTLRAALVEGRTRIETAFFTERRSGLMAARSQAWLADQVVAAAIGFVCARLHPPPSGTKGDRLAIAAVGGYGRGEMAPYSDVDLLFLTPYKKTSWAESVVEATLYILWDLKLKVGHATRSVDDCLRLAKSDVTIRTSLLEKRLLFGDAALFAALSQRLRADLFAHTGSEFVAAKLAERDARHQRTGGSRYLLEPNVKESKGGLRDLQTLYWLAKYLYDAETPEELSAKGVFAEDEAVRCRNAAALLWTVRFGLHYIAGRAQEKLTFDMQLELAARLRYRDTDGAQAVERFMKRYFVAAKDIGDLTRIFCAALEQQHKKTPPLLGGIRRLFPSLEPKAGADWLDIKDGRIMVKDPTIFEREPLKLLELFKEAIEVELLVHPTALRLASRNRRRIDEVKRDPRAARLLLELLTASKSPTRALRRLSETGVLQRLMPEFAHVTGLMQFNMYHHYTVDEHTVLTIDVLQRLIAGELRAEHPVETEIAQSLENRRVITLVLLLHDIGKGLPEDHSVAGERIARTVCPALGVSEAETEQVAWLVRWHLAMSDTAQKRDLSDPATVRAFADLVRSPTRLKLLYLLTACDIRGVGPGVWNGWKAQLLGQLYFETRAILTGGESGQTRADRIRAAQDALRAALPDWSDEAWTAYESRFFPTYWLGLTAPSHALHAEMIARAATGTSSLAGRSGEALSEGSSNEGSSNEGSSNEGAARLEMRFSPAPERDAVEVAFYLADHPGLFARLAAGCALAGASVVDARIYTTKDGMAVNSFWLDDADGQLRDDPSRRDRLREAVERTLSGDVVARDALMERRRLPRRERSFTVPPSVVIDNAASDLFTVVEVNARDRVGLLYDLARALASESVNISSAIIATYGEHAVDVFYVKDLFGMKLTTAGKRQKVEAALLAAVERAGDAR